MPSRARASDTDPEIAELVIFDVIGSDLWGEGVDAKSVVNWLAEQSDDAEIHVRINSPGGAAFEGTAIYNVLARDPRRVVVHVEGLAASAASLVVMAGDEISMAQNALMMIHGASGLTIGTAVDHEDTAKVLHKIDDTLAKTYAARTGADLSDVVAWMDAETWMDADEARERGFADAVTEAKKAEASWGRRAQQVLASFRHPPKHLSASPQPRPQQIAAQAVQENTMEHLAQIRAALGLPEDAQPETVVAAVEALNEKCEGAANTERIAEPDPVAYVPRADFDELRTKLAQLEGKGLDRDIEDAIKAAAGRLVFSDADRDRFRKHLKGGAMSLAAFREEIAARELSPLAVKDEVVAAKTDEIGLTAREVEWCEEHGLDKQLFAKNKAKRQARKLEVVA